MDLSRIDPEKVWKYSYDELFPNLPDEYIEHHNGTFKQIFEAEYPDYYCLFIYVNRSVVILKKGNTSFHG